MIVDDAINKEALAGRVSMNDIFSPFNLCLVGQQTIRHVRLHTTTIAPVAKSLLWPKDPSPLRGSLISRADTEI